MQKYQPLTGPKRIAKAIVDLVWNENILGGCCIPLLRFEANKDLRKNYFTAQACAKAADLTGGKLNGSTWTEMRNIYTKGKKNVRDCPIPAATSVSRAKKVVNEKAKDVIPFEVFHQSHGEGIRFKPKPYTKFLIEAYGLSEKAKK